MSSILKRHVLIEGSPSASKKSKVEPVPLTSKAKKALARRLRRINNGVLKTDRLVAQRALLRAQPYDSVYRPLFYEVQVKKKYFCLLHAVNNALGRAEITVRDVERDRTDPRRAERPAGGPSGFWDEDFFLHFLQQKCGLDIWRIHLTDHDGNPATKVDAFTTLNPEWRQHRYLVFLQYPHKDPKKGGGYPVDKITIAGHAVALVDGHVLDSDTDFEGKYYPLEHYPLRDTIKTIYKIAKRC